MTEPESDHESQEDRELCPDGGCIGLIGEDGRCKLCGAQGSGDARAVAARAERRAGGAGDGGDDGEAEGSDRRGAQSPEGGGVDGGATDDDRELCVDGGCIGLVGPDGRCKVCGLAADAADAAATTDLSAADV